MGADVKSINAVECKSFINIFKVPEQLYDVAYTQVIRETTPKIWEMILIDYLPCIAPVVI